MKKFLVALLFLTGSAQASPITADQIYAPQGLQLIGPSGTFAFPNGSSSNPLDPILSGAAVQSVSNKTFDKSSNVKKQARGIYDFSVSGGATSANISLGMAIPAKALITQVFLDITTQLVNSAGTPTIGISALTGQDILNDTNISSLPSVGLVTAKPVGTTSTFVRLLSDNIVGSTGVTLNIKSGSLSAGKFTIWAEYIISESP